MLTRKLMTCLRQVDKLKTKAATSGGTLDLLLEHLQVQLKMAKIYENNTNNVQVHVDYVLIILKENVKEIYSGGFQADRTALAHTAEGTITITISEADTNTVRVRVTGIIFIPISTEYTEFPTVVVKG